MGADLTAPVRVPALDLLLIGLRRLGVKPLRTTLSALGISIGIATMVVVTGIPASSQRSVLDDLSALGPDVLRAAAVPDPSGQSEEGLPTDAVAMAGRIGPVSAAEAVANVHARVRRSDRVDDASTAGGITVLASTPGLFAMLDGEVSSGTLLTPVEQRLPAVVLGYQAATWLGITSLPAGGPAPRILLDDVWYDVVGILAPMPLADDIEQAVVVGWQSATEQLGFDGRPGIVYVRAGEDSVGAVRSVLARTLNPEKPGLVQVSRPSEVLKAKEIANTAFSTLFLGLAGVALLVGGIGVANTMIIAVLERRREIGLRRALGATRRQIRAQFLTESIVLCVVGGAMGAGLGTLAVVVYATLQGWPVVVPAGIVFGGLGASIVLGAVAGVYPALRASRLQPTQALGLE